VPVEDADGVLETQVAFLDQVEQLHRGGDGVAPGDADHQPKAGTDETVLGTACLRHGGVQMAAALPGIESTLGFAPGLDRLRQLPLLIGTEPGNGADFIEVPANRVSHDRRRAWSGGHPSTTCANEP
jgi:hypothetical protein